MRILALDQATMTGWAVGDGRSLDPCARGEPATIDFGRFKMPKRSVQGERLHIFRASLAERVDYFKPELIAAEEPYWPPPGEASDQTIIGGFMAAQDAIGRRDWRAALAIFKNYSAKNTKRPKTSSDVLQFLQRIYGVLEEFASDVGLPLETYRSPSWRKTALGHGFPENPKKAMILRARNLGLKVEGDDDADAIGILIHALHGEPANARAQGDLLEMARASL